MLLLAAINIGFSLIDPIIFGKLVDLANYQEDRPFNWNDFLYVRTKVLNKGGEFESMYGVVWLVIASITVAMKAV